MNFKHPIAIVSAFAGLTVLATGESVTEIQAVAAKAPEDVARILGKPTGEEKTKYGPRFWYKNGKVEIVFIAGKADWITISDMGSVSFDAKAIEAIGLKSEAPTFQNANVIRWEPHSTYKSVSVFPLKNGKVDYAYVRVSTK